MPKTRWIKILPILFLAATFEHCYSILSLFKGGLYFSSLTPILLVLAIDLSIYFSMLYFELLPARIILVLSGIVSILLNTKYMIQWKPPGTFALLIAVLVGILIPFMLCLFGWLEKALSESLSGDAAGRNLKAVVEFHLWKYPEKSNRQIAGIIGCSHTTVRKYRKEISASPGKAAA